jgi:hypothetical protein
LWLLAVNTLYLALRQYLKEDTYIESIKAADNFPVMLRVSVALFSLGCHGQGPSSRSDLARCRTLEMFLLEWVVAPRESGAARGRRKMNRYRGKIQRSKNGAGAGKALFKARGAVLRTMPQLRYLILQRASALAK